MMCHRSLRLVNRIGSKIRGVTQDCVPRLVWRRKRTRIFRAVTARHDLRSHVPLVVIVDETRRLIAAILLDPAFGHRDKPPRTDQSLRRLLSLSRLRISYPRKQLEKNAKAQQSGRRASAAGEASGLSERLAVIDVRCARLGSEEKCRESRY